MRIYQYIQNIVISTGRENDSYMSNLWPVISDIFSASNEFIISGDRPGNERNRKQQWFPTRSISYLCSYITSKHRCQIGKHAKPSKQCMYINVFGWCSDIHLWSCVKHYRKLHCPVSTWSMGHAKVFHATPSAHCPSETTPEIEKLQLFVLR